MMAHLFTRCAVWAWILQFCMADNHGSDNGPSILVLGAGMSGVTAARSLYDAGYHNITVIEGAAGLGGRMRPASISGKTVQPGTMWLYGRGTNPIYKLLVDNGISMATDFPDTWTARDSSGNDVTDDVDAAQEQFDVAIEATNVDAKDAYLKNLSDFTMRSRLRFHDWIPKTEVDEVVEAANVDFEFATSPGRLSTKYTHLNAPYEAFASEDAVAVNDSRGFGYLVNILADPLVSSIVFNEVVHRVNQTAAGVSVETASGAVYRADHVIVTFSVGVLQHGDVTFSPDLPKCKKMAIDMFEMGHMTQIYLHFSSAFWDDTSMLLYPSEDRGRYSVWVNMNHVIVGSNILQVTSWGQESRRIERLNDSDILNEAMDVLQKMYPNHVISPPIAQVISRWTYDPLTRGAYSYWPMGFDHHNMADLRAPFGRVWFAGEHLDPVQYSYVHAAHVSGLETAAHLVTCLRSPGACPPGISRPFLCSSPPGPEEENKCVSNTATVAAGLSVWYLVAVWRLPYI